jgi:hypothetical protein
LIEQKDREIDNLKQALSVPRSHFKYIEKLTADEIVKQKDAILKEKALLMGVPVENLLSTIYYNTARKLAQ